MSARRIILASAVALAACFGASAQTVPQLGAPSQADFLVPPMLPLLQAIGGAAPNPPCSQSTAFLARTSGLSATEINAYNGLICAMVADGTWANLDYFYWFATNNTTTAALNLVSTSFSPGTVTPTLTFSADHGWTGDAVGGFFSTGYNPSTAPTPHCILNSCSLGVYVLNNRTATQGYIDIGVASADFSSFSYVSPLAAANTYEVNGFTQPPTTSTQAQGAWISTRTGASATASYQNGVQRGVSAADTSATLPNGTVTVFAFGGTVGTAFSGDQVLAAWGGVGVSQATATLISNDVNNAAKVLGINVF